MACQDLPLLTRGFSVLQHGFVSALARPKKKNSPCSYTLTIKRAWYAHRQGHRQVSAQLINSAEGGTAALRSPWPWRHPPGRSAVSGREANRNGQLLQLCNRKC